MSIFLLESRGKTYKNFKEDGHPNLLHCPFHDEGDNVLKDYMFDQKKFVSSQHDGEMLNHFSHQHPLILIDKQTSVGEKLVSLHDPMKRVQLLCDGCVKPIMAIPFYICYQHTDEQCCFVLHEWCAKLPAKIEEYDGHPQHTLFLLSKIPGEFFGVLKCAICFFPSNGFAYGCTICKYYVDINCAFIPKEITHDSHTDHILSKVNPSAKLIKKFCNACKYTMDPEFGFHCRSCDFYIHVECALFLPKIIKHKCDKHPLSLRYEPVENQLGEYFCEYERNGERGRKPGAKRSYGLLGIAKRSFCRKTDEIALGRYAPRRVRIPGDARGEQMKISGLQIPRGSLQRSLKQVLIAVLRTELRLERHRPRSSSKCDKEVPAAVGQNLSTAVRRTVYVYDGVNDLNHVMMPVDYVSPVEEVLYMYEPVNFGLAVEIQLQASRVPAGCHNSHQSRLPSLRLQVPAALLVPRHPDAIQIALLLLLCHGILLFLLH
ncbi:hypothetical protein E3N88_38386 [Mikania micrantha]|uniref:Phorbol-ester/DAG-type domain-containing protein n=1 Tax=Mikania micrantha TaxID=192012 RepID=A0A5N6LTX5_9ASTR|nr:hypothetical protein E3N88_38386 [Mikania micrantha]